MSWTNPPNGFLKLNFDASWISGEVNFSDYIIRDSTGRVCSFGRNASVSCSAIQVEVAALLQGIISAVDLGIRKLVIECDNMAVINAFKGT